MKISLDSLVIGQEYDRPFLANLWGYRDWHAIGRGIVTPKGHDLIILFVTQDKQESLTQYEDGFVGSQLVMEGEIGHKTDKRIIESKSGSDCIYLFFRMRHHMPFTYYGEVFLESYRLRSTEPSIFYFNLAKGSKYPE